MKVKPDVDRCTLPFKGAVVIPQNNVQDRPVKQRLHLNLQGEKKSGVKQNSIQHDAKKKNTANAKLQMRLIRRAYERLDEHFQRFSKDWCNTGEQSGPPPTTGSNEQSIFPWLH